MAENKRIRKGVKNGNAKAVKAVKAAAMVANAAKALDGVAPAVPPASPSNEVPPSSQPEWLDPALAQPPPLTIDLTQPLEFHNPALNLIANAAKINGAMTISEFLAMHSVSGGAGNSLGI